jgi:Carboxypeptidase regulatory-like domain
MAQVKVFGLGGLGGGSNPCCCGGTTTPFCVTVCGGIPLVGAVVTVSSGGTTYGTCTTTAPLGCCNISGLSAGTYTVSVTFDGSTIYSASRSITPGSPVTIAATSGANVVYVCCGGYVIPASLTLTDGVGSIPFVWESLSSPSTWYGCQTVTVLSCTTTEVGGICTANPAASQTIQVCYQMTCNAGSSPVFSLERYWGWIYAPGGLTPIYFSNGTGCSGYTPGGNCAPPPPGLCGGGADASTDSQNPTTTSPFAISFSPTGTIPPNHTSDPIGGSVSIS